MDAPWNYNLPRTLKVGGEERPIRTDYRCILDCFLALTDPDLDNMNKALEVIDILYLDEIDPKDYQEALEKAFWFFNGGQTEESNKKSPQLVSWTQDFSYISSAISKVVGQDIRGIEMHWWTFLSAYMAIGECYFGQIVAIRDKKARGKTLDKIDREFYKRNREAIDIKKPLTEAEEEILKEWV